MVLIFDEVITGFRYTPGGAQRLYGVTPDMTTLAKIVAGGLPGGAVVGRARHPRRPDLQAGAAPGTASSACCSRARSTRIRSRRRPGLTCLRTVDQGEATEHAHQKGEQLRSGMREALARRGVAGAVLGECSVFQVLLGEGLDEAVETTDVQRLMAGRGAVNTLRKAMLLNGVDLMRSGGFTSIAHGDAEIDHSLRAFDTSLGMLQAEAPRVSERMAHQSQVVSRKSEVISHKLSAREGRRNGGALCCMT